MRLQDHNCASRFSGNELAVRPQKDAHSREAEQEDSGIAPIIQFIPKSPHRPQSLETSQRLSIALFATASCVLAWTWSAISRFVPLPSFRPSFVLVGIGLIVTALAVIALRRRLHLRKMGFVAPSPERRLKCVGSPEWLDLKLHENDAAFEPKVFFTLDPVLSLAGIEWGVAILGYGAIIAGAIGLHLLLRWAFFPPGWWMKCWMIWGIAYSTTHAVLMPTYVRIVPGRVDLMRFVNLPGCSPRMKSIPLREAHLLVDLTLHCAHISDADQRLELPFGLVRNRRAFARFLFLASISTYAAPPLPQDELIG